MVYEHKEGSTRHLSIEENIQQDTVIDYSKKDYNRTVVLYCSVREILNNHGLLSLSLLTTVPGTDDNGTYRRLGDVRGKKVKICSACKRVSFVLNIHHAICPVTDGSTVHYYEN